jgi:hypothetical protein
MDGVVGLWLIYKLKDKIDPSFSILIGLPKMISKINTILLCIVIALQAYSLHQKNRQAGRFQWPDTPGKQLGFDTATGQRCWVWSDVTGKDKEPSPSDVPLCSDLARK